MKLDFASDMGSLWFLVFCLLLLYSSDFGFGIYYFNFYFVPVICDLVLFPAFPSDLVLFVIDNCFRLLEIYIRFVCKKLLYMKSILFPLTAIIIFISCDYRETVQGNGNTITESRTVSSFEGIQLSGSMNVHLVQGTDRAVTIEGEENILPYVETYVNDGKLIVKYRDDININTHEDVVVNVTAPELNEIDVTGSGDITGENKFSGNDEMKVEVTGSGNIKLELDAPAVEVSITGSGDIDLSGNTKSIKCSTTGSGEIDATELKAENATVRTLGSGSIRVFASVKLDATINGSGDIAYKGGGSVSSKINGSGTVKAID